MSSPGRHVYEWPRPAFTADVALLRPGAPPRVLLIRRGRPPFAGFHALPGGFVDPAEPASVAAARELREETGIVAPHLVPFLTLDRPGRDPRGRTVTALFLGESDGTDPVAGDDAAEAGWFPLDDPPPLAFDHGVALARLRDLIAAGSSEPGLAALLLRLRGGSPSPAKP